MLFSEWRWLFISLLLVSNATFPTPIDNVSKRQVPGTLRTLPHTPAYQFALPTDWLTDWVVKLSAQIEPDRHKRPSEASVAPAWRPIGNP